MNKQPPVFLVGILATILALGAVFFLNNSRQSEQKLRIQKEMELAAKVVEVDQKQGEITELSQKKLEIESQLESKLQDFVSLQEDMQLAFKKHSEDVSVLSLKLEALTQEKDQLEKEGQIKDKKLAELDKKIRGLEVDKQDLLGEIKKLKEARVGSVSDEETANADTSSAEASFSLGQIIIQKTSGSAAKVEHVDSVYGFLVISAGSRDGLRKDMVVNVVRNNKMVGKAVIQQTRDNLSAALILSDWQLDNIKIGDLVSAS